MIELRDLLAKPESIDIKLKLFEGDFVLFYIILKVINAIQYLINLEHYSSFHRSLLEIQLMDLKPLTALLFELPQHNSKYFIGLS